MISLSDRRVRTITVCHDCGCDVDCGAECKDHPDADLDEVEIIPSELPGRDRAAEMARWCARQALACDAPAEVRAAARMVRDDAPDVATAQVVIGWYQAERREGRL